MNLKLAVQVFILGSALALILFGLSGAINARLGFGDSILAHFWNLEALVVALAIILGYAYPHVRGIRRGDRIVAVFPTVQHSGGSAFALFNSGVAVALDDARVGGKVRIALANGRQAEARVSEYAGSFSLAVVQVTETEVA